MPEFVTAQYLENKLTEFYQILYVPRSRLGLLHIIFPTTVPELWPLIYAGIFVSAQYRENKFDRLIDVRILFLLNVFSCSCSISLELGLFTA